MLKGTFHWKAWASSLDRDPGLPPYPPFIFVSGLVGEVRFVVVVVVCRVLLCVIGCVVVMVCVVCRVLWCVMWRSLMIVMCAV